jgi:hypothetical protein
MKQRRGENTPKGGFSMILQISFTALVGRALNFLIDLVHAKIIKAYRDPIFSLDCKKISK